ncbi:MAG: DUF6364 family protein [Saprospiraceae bacterium]
MKEKITLTIKEEILEVAKKHADRSGQTVEILVENYLNLIAARVKNNLK